MADTVATTYNFTQERDGIINRALRICGAIAQGETASANAITEGAIALNALCKEYQTDGMPLWKVTDYQFTMTATTDYTIGVGQTINTVAPLRIFQAYVRNTNVTPNLDQPMVIITRQDYTYLGNKQQTGRPNQFLYQPPGIPDTTQSSNMKGTITLYPKPDATTISQCQIGFIAQYPFLDFSLSTDIPDFPSYWINAITWGLASELCGEYGLGLNERGWIGNRAEAHKQTALSYGTEEGSLYMRPTVQYQSPGGSLY